MNKEVHMAICLFKASVIQLANFYDIVWKIILNFSVKAINEITPLKGPGEILRLAYQNVSLSAC